MEGARTQKNCKNKCEEEKKYDNRKNSGRTNLLYGCKRNTGDPESPVPPGNCIPGRGDACSGGFSHGASGGNRSQNPRETRNRCTPVWYYRRLFPVAGSTRGIPQESRD